VIEQLRVWSVELAEEAHEAERRKSEDGTIVSDYDLKSWITHNAWIELTRSIVQRVRINNSKVSP
jgi:hypothetical protein